MTLGSSKEKILGSITSTIEEASNRGLLRAGSNQIETTINGQKATIRVFMDGSGNLMSVDAWAGESARKLGNLIQW